METDRDKIITDVVEEIKKKAYNAGLDTAIALVKECSDYESRMTGLTDTIICGLENSKKE